MPKFTVRHHSVPEAVPGPRCVGKSCREHQNEQAELERLQREVAEMPLMQMASQGRLSSPQEYERRHAQNGGVDLGRLAGERIRQDARAEDMDVAPGR